ncbi:single-stranded DNA-binding protein, partial [Salinispora arenicola]|nr:single-stranded DNA-binding protein [Salinispora arenicola]
VAEFSCGGGRGGGDFDDPWASGSPSPSRGGSGDGNFDEAPPF